MTTFCAASLAAFALSASVASDAAPQNAVISKYCLDCHNADEKSGGLALDAIVEKPIADHSEAWEKVVRKLRVRHMPPLDAPRPKDDEYEATIAALEKSLDEAAATRPQPGRTSTFRRLTRTEYQNAIHDLLAVEIDAAAFLPPDESSHGFDNVTVGDLSPLLLERYLAAAQKISRLAISSTIDEPQADIFRVPPDITQEEHVAGLPIGTRGGTLIGYTFPQDGEYEIQVRLARDRNEELEGLTKSHELEVLLDRERIGLFSIHPPKSSGDHKTADEHLKLRIPEKAGRHKLGVTFIKKPSSLLETRRQPYQAHYNRHRHPRISPAVFQVSITGPFDAKGPGESPSRRRVFVTYPASAAEESEAAQQILRTILRRAYRRPIDDADLEKAVRLFEQGRADAGFEAGIELALSSILVNPNFLFRIERDPPDARSATAYRISDVELASRLSFFLWSSIPDDELLDLAEAGKLQEPKILDEQVRRMLKDERAHSLVTNFASQWLHLRNLDSTTPDLRLFPDFDDNLRQAMRRETELLAETVMREDRSVIDLLNADFTFVNERLAKHYGIPHIYGSHFRRVDRDDTGRGGLLRQGSLLTVTSYATRTSPVIRGKWVLENLLGAPPPPPPANVPALKDNTVSSMLSVRERLAEHRANQACASCHNLMDPAGLSLENYDALGRLRTLEDGRPIDASGGLPDGSQFTGVEGLEQALLARPELFVSTLAEKLLTYALGRGVEPHDGPAVRQIVRGTAEDNCRFSSLIMEIVKSTPFQMRSAP